MLLTLLSLCHNVILHSVSYTSNLTIQHPYTPDGGNVQLLIFAFMWLVLIMDLETMHYLNNVIAASKHSHSVPLMFGDDGRAIKMMIDLFRISGLNMLCVTKQVVGSADRRMQIKQI